MDSLRPISETSLTQITRVQACVLILDMAREAVEIIIGSGVLERFAEGRILLSPINCAVRLCPCLGASLWAQMPQAKAWFFSSARQLLRRFL